MSRHAGTVATFLLAAALVYLVGWGLLSAWPMWSMMGVGSTGWVLFIALLVLGLAALGASLMGRRGAAVATTGAMAAEHCPTCQARVEPEYVLCPECHGPLATRCPACARPIQPVWTRCPYCAAAVTRSGDATRAGTDGAPAGVAGPAERAP